MINKHFKRITALLCALTITFCTGCGQESKSVSVENEKTSVIDFHKKTEINLKYTDKYNKSYEQELNEKIKIVQDKINEQTVSYIFITDLHMDSTEDALAAAYRQLYSVVDFANNSDIDFVCVGGDIIDGRHAEEGGKQAALDLIESVSLILKNCDKPVFILKGNHDDNSFSAQIDGSLLYDADYIINSQEWYEATMEHFSQYATDYHNGYFYYDLPGKDVRVVCLNMSDSSDAVVDGKREEMGMYFYGYKDEQLEWLSNSALSKDNCQYIILDHDGFESTNSQYSEESNREEIKAILTAANTHTQYTGKTFSKDFTGFNTKVLAFNCGHWHYMKHYLEKSMGNVPYIRTELSKFYPDEKKWIENRGFVGYTMHEEERIKDTVSEACYDIVVIDKETGKVDITRFGSGEGGVLQP